MARILKTTDLEIVGENEIDKYRERQIKRQNERRGTIEKE